MNLIVSQYLYEKLHDSSEGALTDKLRFTSNDNLDEIIDRLNDEFNTELASFKRDYKPDNPELSADDVEAFIGNYYLKHGSEESKKYFEKLFAKEIDAFDPNTDYISMLQVHTQKNQKVVPGYKLVSDKIVQNNMHEFCVQVFIGGELFGEGVGSSKPKAKKQAALKALEKLRESGVVCVEDREKDE